MAQAVVRPLRLAVLNALKAGVPAVAGRVFTGLAPSGTPKPYLTIGDYAEGESNFFGRSGSDTTALIKGYVATVHGDTAILDLWGEAYAALHRVPLLVPGHAHLFGTLTLLTTYPEPDGSALQFAARYQAETRVVA